MSQKLQHRLRSHEGAVKFASIGADAASNLLVVVLMLSCWRRVCQGRFSDSIFQRRTFHIRILSEDASFRLAFLKARLSDSLFCRRAFQIRLSDGAPFRFAFWTRAFQIRIPSKSLDRFEINSQSSSKSLSKANSKSIFLYTRLCSAALCSACSDNGMIGSTLVYIYIYIYI